MTATDFSQPQRQSAVGILVMFADTVQKYARALWPILLVSIFKYKESMMLYFAIGGVLLIAIIGFVAYLRYRNFTFFLDSQNQEFVVTEGVFSKTKTTIALNKIQQVNIKQSLIQKIIGVHALDVDTAGSQKKEVTILAISHQLALSLKERLLENNTKDIIVENDIESAIPIENHPFVKIGFLSLLKVGITSNYIRSFVLLMVFFSSMYENVRNFISEDAIDEDQIGNYLDSQPLFQVITILIFAIFVIILAMNVVRIVLRYFDFRITKQSGSLLLSFGLLNTKSTIIKPEKVQVTSVSQNYFQKKMDILELKIKQATSGEKEDKKSAIEIPGCSNAEKNEILKLLFKQLPEKGIMLKPNFRKLGFAIFLTIGLPLFGLFLFREYISEDVNIGYLVPVYVILIGLIQYFKFRNNRLFIHDDFIILQSGAWDISNEIIEPEKIQAITTSQLFWHKSINIGSITLHTAGGDIGFQLGNYETLKRYINLWLYELERTDKNWM
ncbi:PH domain-containing protein [Flavobacterium sp. 3HN19-14]|uniref:PH domain-containing protein n=1 Tax=Flavobacterium sp. 3HN19-14 TaxID=3448133 RepID=UPI003EDF99FB